MRFTIAFVMRGIEMISLHRSTLALALDAAYFHKQYINSDVNIYHDNILIATIYEN